MMELAKSKVKQRFNINSSQIVEKIFLPIIKITNNLVIKNKPLSNPSDYSPFFIIGSGRSGNTLLRSMLSSHTNICIPPKSYVLPKTILKFTIKRYQPWKYLVNTIVNEFENHPSFHIWNIDLTDIRSSLYELPKKDRSFVTIIDSVYKKYLDKYAPAANLWGDKSPLNALYASWLNVAFPHAKYIHIVRDGRAVVSSYLSNGLINNYQTACKRWNVSIRNVEKLENNIGSERILHVKFEDLINNPKDRVLSVCEFLKISFEPMMLTYYKNEQIDVSMHKHLSKVKKPIDKSVLTKWRKELSSKQKFAIEKLLYKNLHKYEYLKNHPQQV